MPPTFLNLAVRLRMHWRPFLNSQSQAHSPQGTCVVPVLRLLHLRQGLPVSCHGGRQLSAHPTQPTLLTRLSGQLTQSTSYLLFKGRIAGEWQVRMNEWWVRHSRSYYSNRGSSFPWSNLTLPCGPKQKAKRMHWESGVAPWFPHSCLGNSKTSLKQFQGQSYSASGALFKELLKQLLESGLNL